MKEAAPVNTFHVSLDVTNLEAATRFYRELFGVEPAKEQPGYVKFELDDPPVALALQQAGRSGLSHLGIRVETSNEVESASTRLRESGLATLDERETDCCYALQDKVWVSDPAGNRWELYTVLADTEHNQPAAAQGCCSEPASCCPA